MLFQPFYAKGASAWIWQPHQHILASGLLHEGYAKGQATPAKLNSNQNSELIIYQLPRVLLLIKNWGKLCRIHTEYKQKNKRAKPSKTEKKKSTDDLGICGLRKCEDEQERHL